MNLYSLLKIYKKIRNPRFRAMGMLLLHLCVVSTRVCILIPFWGAI